MKYKDKVVVITGAGKGIGRALAVAYANQGALTVILDKEPEYLNATQDLIEKNNNTTKQVILDLTDVNTIERTFKEIQSLYGNVDILINNAGLGITKSLYELSTDEWDYVINTNLRGTFLCSKEAGRIMRQNGGGSIVNIASTRALMSEPDTFPYSASKGGILSLTHALAVSLGPDQIRVNAISPGWIQTEQYETLRPNDHHQHPSGRVGKPEDIVRACLYLTDPDNGFVTGINLVVDGGMTRKMIYEE